MISVYVCAPVPVALAGRELALTSLGASSLVIGAKWVEGDRRVAVRCGAYMHVD